VDTNIGIVCKPGVAARTVRLPKDHLKAYSGLLPDGRAFVSRARDEAASWRSAYKGPIPVPSLAGRLGGFLQAYTLYDSVRPFGITAILGGWDSEAELPVDGQVGQGPRVGSGGKVQGAKAGGPGLYMLEPSGLYWVRDPIRKRGPQTPIAEGDFRGITVPRQARGGRRRKRNSRSLT
jgi:20S proteasome subunit alpha 7